MANRIDTPGLTPIRVTSKRDTNLTAALFRHSLASLRRVYRATRPDALHLRDHKREASQGKLPHDRAEPIHSEPDYGKLYEEAPVAYLVLDRQGRIVQANLLAAAMLGANRQALLGAALVDFVKKESQSRLERHFDAVFSSNEHQRCRLELTREGVPRLCVQLESIAFDADDKRHCRTALVDTTSYERMEEILQSLTEKLESRVADRTGELRKERGFSDAIINKLPGIVLILDQESQLLRSNITAGTAAGSHSAGPQSGSGWMGFLPESEQETLQEWIAGKLLRKATEWPQEITLSHCDGSQHLYRFTSAVLKEVDKGIDSLICFGTDITDQRSAEAEARQHLDEAARLQRLHTASELATAIGHELSQPLGAICTYADACRQLLRQPSPSPDRLMENLEKISEQGVRGGEIIRELRNFINKNTIDSVPLDLNAVAQKACRLMAHKAKDCGVRLELKPCEDLPPVAGVAIHLEQVILNLVRNAIEAIHDAGMVGEWVTVEVQHTEHGARVTVRDGGPGIDTETATQMLKFLHSTKDYGLGMGICISVSLIKAHGGRLWIESQQPGGVVHFELPLSS